MNFLLKRYLYGISKRRFWLLLVFALPCLYLVISTLQADRFTITQSIAISDSAPVALTSRPTGFMTLKEIMLEPDAFFLNSFAVKTLSNDIFSKSALNTPDEQALIKKIKNNMSMAMAGNDILKMKYHGKDIEAGRVLVNYYAKRMLDGSNEGLTRSNMILIDESFLPTLSEGLYIIEHRALWRSDRLAPLFQSLIVSLFGVLIILWALEWNDSSFKSERQLGRYLNIPVLGSVPDIGSISTMIESNPELT